MKPPLVAVVTISDRCSRGQAEDLSGPALVRLSCEHLGAETLPLRCVPDETPQISGTLKELASMKPPPDLILTTGGTGLAPRDVTPEATLAVIQRRHSGLMEMIRAECSRITSRAYLSRGEAGVCNRSLIINLPGSVRGAIESFEAVLPILPHAIETLRGEVQDDGRPGSDAVTGRVIEHED
ncbi:MAG: MogA/MoaB family molybdenum cofactor biosynthesis protein [Phycisphaeraceae bacterium]|nr:MogA/MoaB family molybdenum cofactor biosynthesis protein [Phycisphaeraceae bacterium]